MKPPPSLLPSETALLVVDVQNDFVDDNGRSGRGGSDMRSLQRAVDEINRLIAGARETGVNILYITVEHGASVDNAPYQARYERRGMTPDDTICHAGTWGAALYPALASPGQGEAHFIKHGYDAFEIPELAADLRLRGVRSVVVTGVVTELCVRATVMSAFEKGFFPIVPREATASDEPDIAREALLSIERWYGEITSVDDVLRRWRSSVAARTAP